MLDDLTVRELRILSDLPYFDSLRALARSKGFQPAHLSKLVAALERKLNIQILKRSSLGVSLTQEGLDLSKKSRQIIEQIEEIGSGKKIFQLKKYNRYYTFGARGFLNNILAPHISKVFDLCFPDFGIRFIDLSPEETVNSARSSNLDFALSLDELDLGKTFIQSKIGFLDWGLFVRNEHPLKNPVEPNELNNFRLIRSAYWNGKTVISSENLLQVDLKHKSWGHEVQTALTALSLIRMTNQLAYIPKAVGQQSVVEGWGRELLVTGAKPLRHQLYFAVHRENIKNSMFQEMSRCLKTVF
jgi:DNA-binding transcriptional LysR family regulator